MYISTNSMKNGIKRFIVLLIACAFQDSFVYADPLAPEVAPRAAKHAADTNALDAAKTATIARLKRDYLLYLDAADKAASANGKPEELALILKARADVTSGGGSLTDSASKALQKRHADYFAAIAAVNREFAPRYQQTNSAFLRDLALIESRLPSSSPVREQITAIKAKLVKSTGEVTASPLIGKWIPGIYKGSTATISINADGTTGFDGGALQGKWSIDEGYTLIRWDNGVMWRMTNSENGPTARLEEKPAGGTKWKSYTATRK